MFTLPAAVKAEIERSFGQPLKYPADCDRLAMSIREAINETIGVTTLKRLFGFVFDVNEPRLSTLDILARYCGFNNYEDLKREVAGAGDSDFEDEPDIKVEELSPGCLISFEYLPDRKVKLRYLGNSQFEVLVSENSSLREGDIITLSGFVKDSPLIAGSVIRNGTNLGRYTAGKVSGISNIYLEEPDATS